MGSVTLPGRRAQSAPPPGAGRPRSPPSAPRQPTDSARAFSAMMTLNHGLSGYVCARVAMPVMRRWTRVPERGLALAFFLGAMLPDSDAVTNLLGGAYYFSDAWYGHRQASHSILGTLVLALVAALPLARRHARHGIPFRGGYAALVMAFWAGGLLHMAGDVFTLRRPLPVFWPLDMEFGALGHIGWFSPYLLWLFLAAIALDLAGRFTARFAAQFSERPGARPAHGGRFAGWRAGVTWGMYAFAAWRWAAFLVQSRYESNAQWWAYQHSLLPAALVDPLAEGVSAAWIWMTH